MLQVPNATVGFQHSVEPNRTIFRLKHGQYGSVAFAAFFAADGLSRLPPIPMELPLFRGQFLV
jgi:hypothetical protein